MYDYEKQKNLMGKARTKDNPYATFEGMGPFGNTTLHVLKVYQKPSLEIDNPYGRWFVAVSTDMTFGSFDTGDTYINGIAEGLDLTYASDEFKEQYAFYFSDLAFKTGFKFGPNKEV